MTQVLEIPDIAVSPRATEQENAYQRLRHAIMIGALAPETTLTIRGLADAMSLSPTPIREAVRRLSSEYAIEVLGNRRMRVPSMTPAKFEEIFNLRVTIETHAAVRALPYVSDIIINTLEEIDDALDQSVEAGDPATQTSLNHDFHRGLYLSNPHQATMPVVESVWLQLGPFQRQVIENGMQFYLVDRHKEIIAALKGRDPMALSIGIEADIRDGIYRSGQMFLQDRAAAALETAG